MQLGVQVYGGSLGRLRVGTEGRHIDRWLSSRAGWSADVLRGVTRII